MKLNSFFASCRAYSDTFLNPLILEKMLDQLISAAKEELGDRLLGEGGLKENQLEPAGEAMQTSVLDTLKDQALGGNMSGIMDLFNGKSNADMSNPIVSGLTKNMLGGLMEKVGIQEKQADMIVGFAVPFLMSKFSSKETGEAADAGDLMSLIGLDGDDAIGGLLKNLGGGSAGDLLGGLSKLF